MDLGIGFLTGHLMLPVLDLLHALVHDYGLSIILLTLAVRLALWPLTAGSIRNARRMQLLQPSMQKRLRALQERFKDDPKRLQQETASVYKRFGNPLAGCLPMLVQLPILFALFSTLRGSPFGDTMQTVQVDVRTVGSTQTRSAQLGPLHNLYLPDGERVEVTVVPVAAHLLIGETLRILVKDADGTIFGALPIHFTVLSGQGVVHVSDEGVVTGRASGTAVVQALIPGVAARQGFLFIEQLGRSGISDNRSIHWDNLFLVLTYAVFVYASSCFTSRRNPSLNDQQRRTGELSSLIVAGTCFFFPLPSGVLLYMIVGTLVQLLQTVMLQAEPIQAEVAKLINEG